MKTDKNILIAIVLSALVIIVYPMIINKFYPEGYVQTPAEDGAEKKQTPEVKEKSDIQTGSLVHGENEIGSTAAAPATTALEEIITVETPLYSAMISTRGGAVKSFKLKDYKIENTEASDNIDLAEETGYGVPFATTIEKGGFKSDIFFSANKTHVSVGAEGTDSIILTHINEDGLYITKEFVFNGTNYDFETNITVNNRSDKTFNGILETKMSDTFLEDLVYFHSGPVVYYDEDTDRFDIDEEAEESGDEKLNWIGLETKYFFTGLLPKEKLNFETTWHTKVPKPMTATASLKETFSLIPGQSGQANYVAYMGPKELKKLSTVDITLEEAIEFGFASIIAKPLLGGIVYLKNMTGNFGVAIIIFTIMIKLILFPLSRKSFKSMREMQKIQPQMQALRERYKEDKQKMNKELMELFQRYKVNPFGGCFPILVQIPVFIGLYEAIYTSIELRHQPFIFWLTDLSAKDPYFITPVLMGITMYAQQKLTPTTLEPMQAKMMLMMPFVLTFVFLNFPSGLMVYWVVNNLLTIAQQQYTYKMMD